MTTSSTALVMVGPSGVGSFHDRLWRISPETAQLVEGGTSGPYFLYGAESTQRSFTIDGIDPDSVLRAVVLAIVLLADEGQSKGLLRVSENLIDTERGEEVAPYWELADDVLDSLARQLSPVCRVGVVCLDETSILTPGVLRQLRELGFDVETFQSSELGPINILR